MYEETSCSIGRRFICGLSARDGSTFFFPILKILPVSSCYSIRECLEKEALDSWVTLRGFQNFETQNQIYLFLHVFYEAYKL